MDYMDIDKKKLIIIFEVFLLLDYEIYCTLLSCIFCSISFIILTANYVSVGAEATSSST